MSSDLKIQTSEASILLTAEGFRLHIEAQMPPSLFAQADGVTLNIETDEPPKLILEAEQPSFRLEAAQQNLIMGVPSPVGTGEANSAANVGGEVEVFRDVIAGILNLRTLRGVDGVNVALNGDVIDISVETSFHRDLDQLVHGIAENSVTEYEYTGSRIDAVRVYTNASKTVKIRDEEYTYVGNKVVQAVTQHYDAAGLPIAGERYVEVFTYAAGKVTESSGTLS